MERIPRTGSASTCKRPMRGDVLVDLRNVFRPDYAEQFGFSYSSIGRPGKTTSE